MSNQQAAVAPRSIETPSGRISYNEAGSGPVALFVHGVVMNKHIWHRQLAGLSDIRRYIAVDRLAHGNTEISTARDWTVTVTPSQLSDHAPAVKIHPDASVGDDRGGRL